MKLKLEKIAPVLLALIIILTIKIISIYYTPLDSDEVMWAVMAQDIIQFNTFYVFFTDQNFRGSLESYILTPFLLLFGLNEITLRINSIIFSLLTLFLIYKIILEITKKDSFAISAMLLYFFSLPEIFFTQNKAWGGYITIQFLMLLVFYLFSKYANMEQSYKKSNLRLIFLGLLLGFSFWINEQAIFFLFLLIGWGALLDFKNLFFSLNKLNKFLYSFYFVSFSAILYFIIKKRMFFNLNTTLTEKLGWSVGFLDSDIYISTLIIYLGISFLILLILNLKKFKFSFTDSAFLNISVFSLFIMLVNFYHNSFSRINNPNSFILQKALIFINEQIISKMFGPFFMLFVLFITFLLFLRIKELWGSKFKNFELHDLIISAFFAFPFMFILSALPGLTPTPRYLLIWWVISVLGIFLAFYKIEKLYPNLSWFKYIFLVVWVTYIFSNNSAILNNYQIKLAQDLKYNNVVNEMRSSNLKTCTGNYWAVGPVFFYSKLEFACFTDKQYGVHYKYLDKFKISDLSQVYLIN